MIQNKRDHSESRGGDEEQREKIAPLGTYVPGQVVFVTDQLDIPMSSKPGQKLCSFTCLVEI